jgi:hypothetical protein
MAQTKTKPKSSSKAKAKSKAKSRSSSKAKPKSSSKAKAKVSSKSKARPKAAAKASRKSSPKANGSSPVSKLKGPATATGAALLAVAGGVAASRSRSSGKSGLMRGVVGKKAISGKKVMKTIKKVDLPDPDDAIDWIEKKAKGLGDAGYKVAEASSQARSAKKAVSGK